MEAATSLYSMRLVLTRIFFTIPREIYFLLLLRLPLFYLSRVKQVIDDAQLGEDDILEIYRTAAEELRRNKERMRINVYPNLRDPPTWTVHNTQATDAIRKFKASWTAFLDSLQKEWSALNLLSALLVAAILAFLTIEGVSDDPITRATSMSSLICGLMSVLYACLFIIRFGPMRKMQQAASWAYDARQSKMNTIWNAWILLAMPAVWLAWSLILFIAAIMSYVWRAEFKSTRSTTLAIRITITVFLTVGVVYVIAILRTLSQYGHTVDKWKSRMESLADEEQRLKVFYPEPQVPYPYPPPRRAAPPPPLPPPPPPPPLLRKKRRPMNQAAPALTRASSLPARARQPRG